MTYYSDATVQLHHGDCLDVLRTLPDASVDAVVTDPPYGLGFMGKEWDSGKSFVERKAAKSNAFDHVGGNHNPSNSADASRTRQVESRKFGAWCEPWTAECLRVLRPGGHLLAFGGSRTYHRLTCAVEDSGFEIRDCITWHFGSGFPKSLNVTDALGRIVPADARCVCGPRSTQTLPGSPAGYPSSHGSDGGQPHPAAAGDLAPAPSPADAPARSRGGRRAGGQVEGPASSGPDADGALPSSGDSPLPSALLEATGLLDASAPSDKETSTSGAPASELRRTETRTQHTPGSGDGSARYKHMACPACGGFVIPQGLGTALKPATEFIVVARKPLIGTVAQNVLTHGTGALNVDGCRVGTDAMGGYEVRSSLGRDTNAGGAHRDFTATEATGRWPANVVLDPSQAAALDEQSGEQRDGVAVRHNGVMGGEIGPPGAKAEGTPDLGYGAGGGASRYFYVAKADASERVRVDGTAHPTVKPLALMRWLVRLVTPPGGTVLEPFAGSGTTVEACILEGFHCIAMEREADYLPLIMQRIHRRRDPVQAVRGAGEDGGLFDLLDGGAA